MKLRRKLAACFAAGGLLVLTSCTHRQAIQLANELTFSLDGISEVTISYDEEKITFYESKGDELVIKEFMTEHKNSYYAKVDQSGSSIRVREGGTPFFKSGFSRYIEVCLPASYRENLTITTTDGDVDLSGLELSLNTLRTDSTAGTVKLNAVEAQSIDLSTTSGVLDADYLKADTIKIDTTSGSFSCGTLEGDVAYTTTSGYADVQSAIGSGSYQASNSGELNVVYTEVTDDLWFYNKNDGIYVTLPADLEFAFESITKNGSIATSFQECLSSKDRTISGIVGDHPTVTIKVETHNGDIEVTR